MRRKSVAQAVVAKALGANVGAARPGRRSAELTVSAHLATRALPATGDAGDARPRFTPRALVLRPMVDAVPRALACRVVLTAAHLASPSAGHDQIDNAVDDAHPNSPHRNIDSASAHRSGSVR